MRLRSIDYLRSTALLALVFLHASIFSLSDPYNPGFQQPLTATALFGMCFLFGGAFIMMSGIVNTVSAISRLGVAPQYEKRVKGISRSLAASGTGLLVLHFIYVALTGPLSIQPGTGTTSLSLLPLFIRTGSIAGFEIHRVFEGSIISTIGWNLIIMALLWRALFSRRIVLERKLQYPVLIALSFAIFAFALFNPSSYQAAQEVYDEGGYPLALVLSFFLGMPFPLYPYTSFALLGMLTGFLLFEKHPARYMLVLLAAGLAATGAGLASFLMNPPGINIVMENWRSRVVMEMGFFLTASAAGLLFIDLRKNALRKPAGAASPVSRIYRSFGMMAITVLVFETPLAELTRKLWNTWKPGWNTSFRSTMEYAGIQTALWCLILWVWKAFEYRGSIDHAVSALMKAVHRKSERFRPEIFDKTGKIPL